MSIEQKTDILDEVVRRLVDAFQPERIYLFGSRARGDHHEDSDYDVLVVLREPAVPKHELNVEAYRVLRGIGVSVDVLIWSRKEFDRQAPVVSSLPETVLYEGQLVYGS
jgi:predicted nucleotidyltransferase